MLLILSFSVKIKINERWLINRIHLNLRALNNETLVHATQSLEQKLHKQKKLFKLQTFEYVMTDTQNRTLNKKITEIVSFNKTKKHKPLFYFHIQKNVLDDYKCG